MRRSDEKTDLVFEAGIAGLGAEVGSAVLLNMAFPLI
jgi:hypothetical protein